MATLQQHRMYPSMRLHKFHKKRTLALKGNPQKRGVVNKIGVESPKKPNSAKRKVARVRLCTGKNIRVKVPGPGVGNLQKFSPVLIRASHPRDLPGVRYSIIRGKLGSNPVLVRRKARSKYGIKKRHLFGSTW